MRGYRDLLAKRGHADTGNHGQPMTPNRTADLLACQSNTFRYRIKVSTPLESPADEKELFFAKTGPRTPRVREIITLYESLLLDPFLYIC